MTGNIRFVTNVIGECYTVCKTEFVSFVQCECNFLFKTVMCVSA